MKAREYFRPGGIVGNDADDVQYERDNETADQNRDFPSQNPAFYSDIFHF